MYDFLKEMSCKIKSLTFRPLSYVVISVVGLSIIETYQLAHTSITYTILRELFVFLFIAGAIGFLLHVKEFKKKFANLLYLHSDYLKNLGESKKKEFFIRTLKNAYDFSDYGIEDEFADLTTRNYLPVFEEKYKSNHFVHRTFKPYKHGSSLKEGISVKEEQGWRAHYPKNIPQKMEYGTRGMKFKDFEELYRRMFYSSEVWMKEANPLGNKEGNKITPKHVKCGKIIIDIKETIAPATFTREIKNLSLLDFNAISECATKAKEFLHGTNSKLGIRVTIYKKDGTKIVVTEPKIKIGQERKIDLVYKIDGTKYLQICINFNKNKVTFETGALLNKVKAKKDYHFVVVNEFYNYYCEPFALMCGCPTKSVIISVLFEGLNNEQKVIADTMYLAYTGTNPMIQPIQNKYHYSAKFSGWFFVGHGIVFTYRIVNDKVEEPLKISYN